MPFKEGLTFTSSQKRGIFVLVLLILLAISTILLVKLESDQPLAPNEFADQYFAPPVIPQDTLLRLDINLADSVELRQLKGIGPVLSQRIVKFRESRGGFQSIHELKQVYGLSPETFEVIKPNILVNSFTIPSSPNAQLVRDNPTLSYSIDINNATPEDFEQLPGIGPTLSHRIVKYREALGGFQEVDQIKKVYHLKPEVFNAIRKYLYINTALIASAEPEEKTPTRGQTIPSESIEQKLIRFKEVSPGAEQRSLTRGEESTTDNQLEIKSIPSFEVIDINTADSIQLVSLPGIGAKTASRIVKYRKLLGFYSSVNLLQHVYGLSRSNFEKAQPYLRVGDLSRFPKRDFNTVFARNLAFYPFIDKALAEKIIAERKNLGRFDSWQEVADIPEVGPELISQLQVYFEL